jgi:hypothetical protein
MLRRSTIGLRKRSAWRDLLHPLSPTARRSMWLKRDVVEQNEAVLRRPYYVLAADNAAHRDAAEATDFGHVTGPQLEEMSLRAQAFAEGNAAKIRSRYPETIETIPPQYPLRTTNKSS